MSETTPGLKKLAKNRRFEELEAATLEQIEDGSLEREELLTVLRLTSHRADEEFTESFLWLCLGSWAEKHGAPEGVEVARGTADLLPTNESIREAIAEVYREAHGEYPGLASLIGRTVLAGDLPLPEGVRILDGLIPLPPGGYFMERGSKTPGRVLGLAEDAAGLEVEIRGGVETPPLETAADLVPLPDDSIPARAIFDKGALSEFAKEQPARLVEELLRAHGPVLNYRALRAHLVDVVPGGWAAWWNESRPTILRSPWIDVSGGTQPTLEIRKVPLSHEREILISLNDAEPGVPKLVATLDYLDDAGEHAAAEEALLTKFVEALSAQADDDDPTVAIASIAVHETLRRAAPDAVAEDDRPLPLEAKSPAELLYPLEDPRLERSVLELVEARTPDDWQEFFAAAMPSLSLETCEWAGKKLREEDREDLLNEMTATVMAHPRRFPGALMWIWKAVGADEIRTGGDGPDGATLMVHFLSALDRASRGEDGKTPLYNRLKGVLTARNHGTARKLLSESDIESARTVKEALDRCLGLSDVARTHIADLLVETHPKLYVTEYSPWEQEDVIYTTRKGLERRQGDLNELVNERLPAVARAIGVAAAQGDLSENAEYTAALEERARLTERANVLQVELKIAREIPPEMPGTEVVTVGSRIRARRVDSDEEKVFVFLGPWDANLEQGIYSYRAPVSQTFMGTHKGDVVLLKVDREQQRWEIIEIGPGI